MKHIIGDFGWSVKEHLTSMIAGPVTERVIDTACSLFQGSVFVIAVRPEGVRIASGDVRNSFVNDCADVVESFGITNGKIRGAAEDGNVGLWISPTFPPQAQQRIRNAFALWQPTPKSEQVGGTQTGHQPFKHTSLSIQSRRWAHINRSQRSHYL